MAVLGKSRAGSVGTKVGSGGALSVLLSRGTAAEGQQTTEDTGGRDQGSGDRTGRHLSSPSQISSQQSHPQPAGLLGTPRPRARPGTWLVL